MSTVSSAAAPAPAQRTGRCRLLADRRRAPGAAGRARLGARVRRPLRALPPAAVPLLPLDRARRRRRAGRAPVDVHAPRCRRFGAIRRNAPLRPWLYRIAHNEAISLLRRRRRESGKELSDVRRRRPSPRPRTRRTIGRAGRRWSRDLGDAPGASARRARDARAERALARGDRDRARDRRRRCQAGDLRGASGAGGAGRGARDEL